MSTSKRFVTKNGLDNNGNSITNLGVSGASLTLSGANALTITTSGATNVTFPTSGTLLTTAGTSASATILATARTIGGSSFDGSANVTSFPVPGAIGGTTPSTGAFTSLSANTNIVCRPTTSTHGYIAFEPGNVANSGYIQFMSFTGGVRQGYIGFSNTNAVTIDTGTLPYVAGTHAFTGALTTTGAATINGHFQTTSTARMASLQIGADADILLYESSTNAFTIRAGTTGTEKYTTFAADGTLAVASGGITTTDRILVAGSTAVTQSNGETPYLQLNGTDSRWGIGLSRFSANAAGTGIYLGKSRGAAVGTFSIVSSGDELGRITFSGADGTDLNTVAAQITAYVDGTPGANDMPGRLVFSTTADGASTPTDRMTIANTGSITLGTTTAGASESVRISKNITGGATAYGLNIQASIQSDVTGAYLHATYPTTQATAFTLGSLRHYSADQNTFGAGSTVTNQYGFIAEAGLTGAVSNFGFYGNIPAGTNRYNLYMAGTADNYLSGSLGIGTAPLSTTKVFISNTASSTTVQEYGLITQSTFTNASGAINKFGTYAQAYTGASFAGTATVIGLGGLAQQNAASTGAGFSLVGVLGSIATTSTGTIGNACAFQTGLTATGGATIANGIGLLINDHSVGGGKFGIYSAMTAAANKYNIYVAGTADNYFAGNVGIGGNSAGVSLRLAKTLTGTTTTFGIRQSGQVQSDSTAEAYGILNEFSTQATAFTLPSYVHLGASQSTIGAGSSVTNQYGVYISSNLIGATNNFGVHSNIPSGTNRYNIYAGGTAPNYFAGNVGVGGIPVSGYKILNYGSWSGSTTFYGISSQGDIQSDVTATVNSYRSAPTTQAAAFTLTSLNGYIAEQGTFGAGSAVTNQYGFHAAASLIGASTNVGFFGNIPSGANRYNFYASGTAENYFAGKVSIGTGSATNTFFRVSGSGTGTDTSTVLAQGTTTASSTHNVFYSLPTTSATALGSLTHFYASQSTLGGTLSNQYGFRSDVLNIGATNNYGFFADNTAPVTASKTAFGYYSNINIATGGGTTWGFFSGGTANNAFAGKVRVGGVTAPVATLDVTGSISATSGIVARTATSTHGYATLQQGNATNSGYLEFFSHTGGVRQGFIGFSSTNASADAGTIPYSAGTHSFTGTMFVTGVINAASGVDKLTTASGVVSVAAATAPSTGQVLMATSATTATWQTPAAGGTVTLSNDTATNATYYPTIATATSGTLSALKVSSTKFTFNPSTGTMSATILNSLSDANFKTNVAPLTDSAEVVKALQGVSFDWKDGSGSSYGFIAQEVQKIIPHAVSENDNKLGVNYSAIVPFLVETIKTQEDRIARLEEMVAKLLKA